VLIFRSTIVLILVQLSFWRWAQSCSKHVDDSNKLIIEEIVRQVGHLPELYKDAQSQKYKINLVDISLRNIAHFCWSKCLIVIMEIIFPACSWISINGTYFNYGIAEPVQFTQYSEWWPDNRGTVVWFLQGQEIYFVYRTFSPAVGLTQSLIQWVPAVEQWWSLTLKSLN